jgi:hypothetical protein
MEFSHEMIVNVPRERFIELFDDLESLPKWQEGLLSFEPLTGTPGQPGATSKLTYKQGKGTLEMIETITRRDLPNAFDATYDARGVHNISRNEFFEAGPGATRWVAHNVFEFHGLMRVIGLLFGKSFPKENARTMEAFKSFAERSA